MNSKDWAMIIVEKDDNFLMVNQFRTGIYGNCEEFCAGGIEFDEYPQLAAIRELAEETGYKIDSYNIEYLGKFAANSGLMDNYMHYFYVNLNNIDIIQGNTNFDENENIKSYWKNKNKVVNDIFKNENSSVFMTTALLLLLKNNKI